MDHSFDPLIHATVRATVGAIRQTQTTNSVNKLNIGIKTGKGIVPVKNSLSPGKRSKSGVRRRGNISTSVLRDSVNICPNTTRNDSILVPIVATKNTVLDEQLMQEIVRQVKIHTTKAFKQYELQLLESLKQSQEAKQHQQSQNTERLPDSSIHAPNYLQLIASAQEFLNKHRNADLFQAKCLLRTMFPREYHDIIEALKENQDPTIIYNISGGNNQIAINPNQVTQNNSDQ